MKSSLLALAIAAASMGAPCHPRYVAPPKSESPSPVTDRTLYQNKTLGISFEYPASWREEPVQEQRNGADQPATIRVTLSAPSEGSEFMLEYYHLAEARSIYNDALQAAHKGEARERMIAGVSAVETVQAWTENARGEKLAEPSELRSIVFPDARGSQTVRITMRYPARTGSQSVQQLEELLKSFQFLKR